MLSPGEASSVLEPGGDMLMLMVEGRPGRHCGALGVLAEVQFRGGGRGGGVSQLFVQATLPVHRSSAGRVPAHPPSGKRGGQRGGVTLTLQQHMIGSSVLSIGQKFILLFEGQTF